MRQFRYSSSCEWMAGEAGSIVHVAKKVDHRFYSVEEERRPKPVEGLTLLVFLAPAEYSSKS